jgi:hypothetical protein
MEGGTACRDAIKISPLFHFHGPRREKESRLVYQRWSKHMNKKKNSKSFSFTVFFFTIAGVPRVQRPMGRISLFVSLSLGHDKSARPSCGLCPFFLLHKALGICLVFSLTLQWHMPWTARCHLFVFCWCWCCLVPFYSMGTLSNHVHVFRYISLVENVAHWYCMQTQARP